MTPEAAADKMFNDFFFSRQANNPEIFALDVDTGEPLAPDHDYDSWRHRFLGRSSAQKAGMLVILPLSLAFFYALIFLTFLPAAVWSQAAFGIALSLTILLAIQIYSRWKAGRLRTAPGQRKIKKYDILWMPPFAVFLIWFILCQGVGGAVTAAAGTPHKAFYRYEKDSGKPCVRIKGAGTFTLNKYCLKRAVFDTLPEEGEAGFTGKASWFGVTLEEMDALSASGR